MPNIELGIPIFKAMGLKSSIAKWISTGVRKSIEQSSRRALEDQQKILNQLLVQGKKTSFGQDHHFSDIVDYTSYVQAVPVRTYEGFGEYIDRVINGLEDVLWPGKPKYLAKTSGTTSGIKYIPVSHGSIKTHITAARNSVLNYIALSGRADIFDGKMIFLSGSPVLNTQNGIHIGRLSGIVNHEIPNWVQANQVPSTETNCIEDWESKVDAIVRETHNQDLRVISGIPPWVQMYFERLLDFTGKSNIKEVFPNFKLFAFGGVSFEPYRQSLEKLIGGSVDYLETYPASEGFIAYQDQLNNSALLLNTNAGIFYEFITLSDFNQGRMNRISLDSVELGVDYVLLLSTTAGLWAYNIGDTIQFVSSLPYRLIVTGRVKHFISAFGEHVIAKEVESAMQEVSHKFGLKIIEFTVAPQVNPLDGGLPHHEWFIEFSEPPRDYVAIAKALDDKMCDQNIYYKDLIEGAILKTLQINPLKKGAFIRYMQAIGKLGGQNKVPRLTNDRKIATALESDTILEK